MTDLQTAAVGTMILKPGMPFTSPELAVLRADGVLRAVLPGAFVCAALDDSAEVRTAAVAALVGPRLGEVSVIGRLTAAWVHGYHPPPGVVELLVARFHRLPLHNEELRTSLHECLLSDEEILRIGHMQVTTPVRTALDIAFHVQPVAARPVLCRMLGPRGGGCSRGELLEAICATGRRPGKRAALELVHGLPRLAANP